MTAPFFGGKNELIPFLSYKSPTMFNFNFFTAESLNQMFDNILRFLYVLKEKQMLISIKKNN